MEEVLEREGEYEDAEINEVNVRELSDSEENDSAEDLTIHYIALMNETSEDKEPTIHFEPLDPVPDENYPITAGDANNPTLLYIAVEYLKNNLGANLANPSEPMSPENFTDYDSPQVSPLDPNMSSVAPHSPLPVQYQENSNSGLEPIIIHQFNKPDESFINDTPEEDDLVNLVPEMPNVLCNSDLQSQDYQYLGMINGSNMDLMGQNDDMQISENNNQEVELLIPDPTTGILYSVNAQDFLAESCLENNQELQENTSSNPILEQNLFSTTDMNDTYNSAIITSSPNEENLNGSSGQNDVCSVYGKVHTRSNCPSNIDEEEKLLSCVYSITDKPILSKARASLPETYLTLSKIDGEDVVLARRKISKRTQFGPLKGSLTENDNGNTKFLKFAEGYIYSVDVSDENLSNWMGFVRKAQTYEEQNLILTQEGQDLYFTATMDINPRKELKFGYSRAYARLFNLDIIKPIEHTFKKTWTCYECFEKFSTAEELNGHSIIHAQDENTKPKRRYKRPAKNKTQVDLVECNNCLDLFCSTVSFVTLKNHLTQNHNVLGHIKIEDYFSMHQLFQCNVCDIKFKLEILLKIHKLEHYADMRLDLANHVCPQCQRKFPTRKQLVMHMPAHAVVKNITKDDSVKCPICHKIFAHSIRVQKHMLCHGSEESKPLQCNVCQKRFLTASALAFHAKTHVVGVKHFQCPICKERFDQVLKLRKHIPAHLHNDMFTCPYCEKTFTKYSIIRKHIRFHNERKYHCTVCPKSFPTQENLKKHMLRHSDHREFLCSDCGKQFKRKDKLVEHIKKLHLEKEVITHVPRIPRVRNSVTVNLKEPADFHRFIYKCYKCLVGFKRRGMLVNHLVKRHPDITPDSVPELNLPILQTTRDYYCQYCDKVYKSSSKRRIHILKFHPGAALPVNKNQKVTGPPPAVSAATFSTTASVTTRPKKCEWCHKQYASKSKLLQHVRKAHPSEENLSAQKVPMIDFKEIDSATLDGIPESPLGKLPEQIINFMPITKDVEPPAYLINQNDEFSDVLQNQYTTDGNMTDITKAVIDRLIDEDSKYLHLSIDEGELENTNSHLYQLLTSNDHLNPIKLAVSLDLMKVGADTREGRSEKEIKAVGDLRKSVNPNTPLADIKTLRLGQFTPGKIRPVKVIFNTEEAVTEVNALSVLRFKGILAGTGKYLKYDQTKAQRAYLGKVMQELEEITAKGVKSREAMANAEGGQQRPKNSQ
ncbi:unnamed protein product [Ceutorhynchus assimilis]|uniref:PR domain zinc finger protein 10 n=1 Tax=Ceutorhynchus assimilis TaxID=467358 RepID=A0A9N9MAZ3_9CUCU|nr:unnamed protein product [Ceutorhynchus assimilis]